MTNGQQEDYGLKAESGLCLGLHMVLLEHSNARLFYVSSMAAFVL